MPLRDLVLRPSANADPTTWNEGAYAAFVDELCQGRDYQKAAIFAVLRYLLGGNYQNLQELAKENYDKNEAIRARHGASWRAMRAALQFPDKLACSADLATGTGKSYVLYGIAAIMLAEGAAKRALTLCPSLTIEQGLIEKFKDLAGKDNLRAALPEYAAVKTPMIVSSDETVTEGCICVENYHATLERSRSSVNQSFAGNGETTVVLNDEAHHVATGAENKKWKGFLLSEKYGFRRIVGVSGTCYVGNNYFCDVVCRYSLRDAINDNVVKNVEYVADAPRTNNADERLQLIYQQHRENARELKSAGIRPLTIIVTATIKGCEAAAEELRAFLEKTEGISAERAGEKALIVTSDKKHEQNVKRLRMVDSPQSKVEWIVSVSMLTEGWDVKNVFQIVPHEARAFSSKLLISQVLGRGLRVPEGWPHERQPVVTVFNHSAWAARIENLVNEVLESERRISCIILPKSPHHFDLHNIDYDHKSAATKGEKTGEGGLVPGGYIPLPTLDAIEEFDIGLERVRGGGRVFRAVVRHKAFTAAEIAEQMWRHLKAVDNESAEGRKPTDYAKRYSLPMLENIARESARRAKIKEDEIPDKARRKFLAALSGLERDAINRVTYNIQPRALTTKNTKKRPIDSCGAAEIRGDKTIFYRSDCARHLPGEQSEFFKQLTDRDGEYRGQAEKADNDHHFKTPTNLVIASHKPERLFVRRLLGADAAAKIAAWIKNPDKGFYAIEYAWSRDPEAQTARRKRGMFSPDFFVKLDKADAGGTALICVVEIKDDGEVAAPSHENAAKYDFAEKHFKLLNDWLEREGIGVRYRFNMLTPIDYDRFFTRIRNGDIADYWSHLDAAIREKNLAAGRGD